MPVDSVPPPPQPFPLTGQWFLLHTRSRQEKAVATDLAARGIGYFLPLIRSVRRHGSRKVTVDLPMFTGYVFLRGTREEAFEADRTQRVANIIDIADQARADNELRHIYTVVSKGVEVDPYPYLQVGRLVRVRSGPLQGVEGILEERRNAHRLVLRLHMLHRAVSLEIDAAVVEPV